MFFGQAGDEGHSVIRASEADPINVYEAKKQERKTGAKCESVLGDELSVQPQPMEALTCVVDQFSHTTGVKDERTHRFIQLTEKLSLLPGQLLGLLPHLSGKQEVGGDLHVAGGHLVDALWDGDGGTAALAGGAAGRVTARAAWRHFGRDRGRHSHRFIPHPRRRRLSVTQRVLQVFSESLRILQSAFLPQFKQAQIQERLTPQTQHRQSFIG